MAADGQSRFAWFDPDSGTSAALTPELLDAMVAGALVRGSPWEWAWRKWPLESWDAAPTGSRYGQPCLVLARGRGRGPRNVLVQFEDGQRLVAPRFAVRRKKEGVV